MSAQPNAAKLAALQALLEAGNEVRELTVTIGDTELLFRYRPLSWLEKSEIISEATEYRATTDRGGELVVKVVLHQDVYKRLALARMLVDPPVPMTDQVLRRLPNEVGDQFEAIIPSPFTTGGMAGAKKEPASSSEEPEL